MQVHCLINTTDAFGHARLHNDLKAVIAELLDRLSRGDLVVKGIAVHLCCVQTTSQGLQRVMRGCRSVDILHLASNMRYVFDCHEWVNKKCRNERVLMKPWVQPPPVQPQDWRVTEVYPAQV